MARLTFSCHPALEPILPKPVSASQALPAWLKEMPSEAASETLGGASVRTLKHCPPFIDAFGMGALMPLVADITIAKGEISWEWDPPAVPDQAFSRSPIGVHVPEQGAGAPLPLGENFALKFMNYWTIAAPEGWSVLFTHPLNREDLPFRTLSGVVQCDQFVDGFVHFPALWVDPDFEGVLPAGTPVAQAIPTPRGALALAFETFDAGKADRVRATQDALQAAPGFYRRLKTRATPKPD